MPSGATRSRVTDDMLEQIIGMGEAGKPTTLIARSLQLPKGTVHYHLVLAGVKAPADRHFDYVRRGAVVRSFSPEEDRAIEAFRLAGKGASEIARLVSERFGHRRNSNTVAIRLVQLANREEAAASTSQ